MKLDIYNKTGKKTKKKLTLSDSVFGITPNEHSVYLAVNSELAALRQGTHSSKTRSEVSGGGAKPYRQKGTGRARQGDKKSPHMRGGGVAFGPIVRSHSHSLPKKVRRLALKTALSAKQADGQLIILDSTLSKTGKKADLVKKLKKIGLE